MQRMHFNEQPAGMIDPEALQLVSKGNSSHRATR